MTAQTDLLYSDTEDDLRAAVRALLTERAGHQVLLDRIETDDPYVPGLWKSLAGDIGAAGLLVPEELGGQGASHREAAVVLEELGRAVTPLPYLTSAVVATETLLALAGRAARPPGSWRSSRPVSASRFSRCRSRPRRTRRSREARAPRRARCAVSPTRSPPTCSSSRVPTACTRSRPPTPSSPRSPRWT